MADRLVLYISRFLKNDYFCDMATVDSALDEIMKLDYASREMILEILQMRQIEARRDEIVKNAKQSLKDFRSGKTPPMSAAEVIEKLNTLQNRLS